MELSKLFSREFLNKFSSILNFKFYFMCKLSNCILALYATCPTVICSHYFSYRKEVAFASELWINVDKAFNKNPLHFSLELKSTYIWISCYSLTFLSVLTKLSPSRIKKNPKTKPNIFHFYQPLEHSVLFITALSIHSVFSGKRCGITAKNLLLVL